MKEKRWFYIITGIILLIGIATVTRNSLKTVPEDVLWERIDAFVDEQFTPNIKQQLAPRYWSINYSFSVTHPWNFRIRTDKVHVKLLLEEEHFSAAAEYDAEYTYDKESRTWTASNEEWSPIRVIRYKNI